MILGLVLFVLKRCLLKVSYFVPEGKLLCPFHLTKNHLIILSLKYRLSFFRLIRNERWPFLGGHEIVVLRYCVQMKILPY